MIPMDLLGILFRALDLNKVSRLILVGDPNQLPPIGPGRPFVDIIAWLEADDERKKCLARLVVQTRCEEHEGDEYRPSQALQLADGYLRDDTSPGDDDILSRVAREDVGGDLEVRYWRDSSQLEEQIAASMKKHLKLTDGNRAYISFNASLGIAEDPKDNNPLLAERWQILSPVRNHEFGTTEINRVIQAKYRGGMLNYSKGRRGVKPFGEQEIVWTDKVMQAINCRKTSYPKTQDGLSYVANGEIGLVVQTSEGSGGGPTRSRSSSRPNRPRPTITLVLMLMDN